MCRKSVGKINLSALLYRIIDRCNIRYVKLHEHDVDLKGFKFTMGKLKGGKFILENMIIIKI